MAPRTDDNEQDNDNLSDDGLKEDMAALARACMIAGPRDDADSDNEDEILAQEDPLLAAGNALVPIAADSDSDEQSDLKCLKRVQSLYQPTDSVTPPAPTTAASDGDEEGDFETVRAIFKRFSAYDGEI